MKRECSKCGNEIPIKRLEILPNTKTCVNCSETGKKGGVTVQLGEGDHTYNEIIILDPEEIVIYNEKLNSPLADDSIEKLNLDSDESFPSMNEIQINLEKESEDADSETFN